jgi:hypothetical protein
MPQALWSSGRLLPVLKALLRVFDLPESMATTRVRICTGTVETPAFLAGRGDLCAATSLPHDMVFPQDPHLTRFELGGYYAGCLLFMGVIAADVVGYVIGLYLYISVNWFHLHWNEAFSSIRSPDFKSFVRMHIDEEGDLHVYAVGMDRTPRSWRADKTWTSALSRLYRKHFERQDKELDVLDPEVASYGAPQPSRWMPAPTSKSRRAEQEPKIVDYFCIPKNRRWVRADRKSTLLGSQWWDAFGDLEKKRFFRRAPSAAAQAQQRPRNGSTDGLTLKAPAARRHGAPGAAQRADASRRGVKSQSPPPRRAADDDDDQDARGAFPVLHSTSNGNTVLASLGVQRATSRQGSQRAINRNNTVVGFMANE